MSSRRPLILLVTFLVAACSNPPDAATTTASSTTTTTAITSTSTSTTEPATSTVATTTTTTGASTTTGTLPGDPIDFGPASGQTVAVIGVAHDDVLNLRSAPGADQEIVARIPPLYDALMAKGAARELPRSIWIWVDYEGMEGWVNLSYIGYIGATFDATADVIANLGETPTAGTMLELGQIVAESLASDEPASDLVVTVAPSVGDLGEVTFDVIGLGDDAVRGVRAHIFGEPLDGAFSLRTVEVTSLCGRGVTDDGACV